MSTITIEREETENSQMLDLIGIELKREEISDPASFLYSDRGEKWMASILSGAYYTRWYEGSQRSPYELDFCNKIAGKVLESKYSSLCPGEVEEVIEEHFNGVQEPDDVYHNEHRSDIERKVRDLAQDIEDLGDEKLDSIDEERWCDEIRDIITNHMAENDDSSVYDMFGSYDRFELVVRFDPNNNYIAVNGYGPDFNKLCIDQALRNNLARLGYTIGDYRRMSGRTNTKRHPGEKTKCEVPVRSRPLISEKELRSLVEESCATNFSFVLYASISLTDIFKLDLTKPIVLSNCAIASYNSMNGTFFDVQHKAAVILDPKHDRLTEAWGYSPEDVCCLYMPYYHAKIANVQ